MSVNQSLNYLKAEQSVVVLHFSEAVTTSSKYLKGAGGVAGDGFAMPFAGKILGLQVYDGTTLCKSTQAVEFSADDRISVYANHSGSNFNVYARKNGINTTCLVTGLPENVNLQATVTCRLTE